LAVIGVMLINEISELMEKTCKNCKYFVSKGISYFSSPRWGDCMKPRGGNAQVDVEKERGVFVWDDNTCSDFEPEQKRQ
jgi:hypothetical protein